MAVKLFGRNKRGPLQKSERNALSEGFKQLVDLGDGRIPKPFFNFRDIALVDVRQFG